MSNFAPRDGIRIELQAGDVWCYDVIDVMLCSAFVVNIAHISPGENNTVFNMQL